MTKELILAYYAAFNEGDIDTMLALVSDEIVHDVNQGARRVGKEKFATFNAHMARTYRETLSDVVVMTDGGNRAAAEFIVSGTYLVTDEGLPEANGQTYRLSAGAFFEVGDGKITRVSTYYNLTDWMTQVTGKPL